MTHFNLTLNSLKTRVTLLTLGLFLLGIWSLTFFTSHMLREDLQQLLGEQQFSIASLLAVEMDHELADRLQALQSTANEINATTLGRPTDLQNLLETRPLLSRLFNDSLVVTGLAGKILADYPRQPGRVGMDWSQRDYIAGPIQSGQAVVGKPVRGKLTQNPVFVMSVPIKGSSGQVIGVLGGVVDLNKPNFLDQITADHVDKQEDYFLVAPQHRLNVTSSNKSRIMAVLPEPGISAALDRQAQGFEGTQIFINPLGVEVLTSVKQIPAVGWYVAITLATDKAFTPITAMQQRMLLAATTLSVMLAVLTWLGLRYQLRPLMDTAEALARHPDSTELPPVLPVTRSDEVGTLITSFNQLLANLHQRKAALQESEERFRTLIEWSPEAFAVHRNGKVIFVNPAAVKLMGAESPQQLLDQPMLEWVHPDFRLAVQERVRRSLADGVALGMVEEKFIKLDGSVIDVEVTGIAITFDGQRANQVLVHDVTDRNRAQEQLRQLSLAVEQAPIAIVITNLQGQIEYANPCFTQVTGYTAAEVLGSNPRLLQSGQTPPAVFVEMWETLLAGQVWQGELHNRKKDGTVFIEHAVIAPVLDVAGQASRYVALKQDITRRKQAEQMLQSSLQEKIALLHEVHHRVKNNLQVVTSLLRLESSRSAEPATKTVLKDMQARIYAMALLHESLYRAGNFAWIDLGAYLKQLATQAFRSQAHQGGAVQLVLDIAAVKVSLDQATPCGLLVNELLSNALKHGFPEGRAGSVLLRSQPGEHSGWWCVSVQDWGIGLPDDFDLRQTQSLGLQLVSDLARQLGGTLATRSVPKPGSGVCFSVSFPVAT